MKKIKQFFSNRPWKDIKTRKISFIFCIVCGTFAIIFSAIMSCFGKFDADWLHESLNFFKWIITTGIAVVLVSSTSDLMKIFHKIDSINDEGDEE